MNLNKYSSILENSVSLFSLKAIDLALNLWLIPFLILKVGLYNYGLYAFAMALVLFFVNLLNYGFNLSTVRDLAKTKGNPQQLQTIFNEVFSVKLVLFLFLTALFLVLTFWIPKFSNYKTLYLMSSLLLLGDLFSLRWFFMGLEKMKFIALIHLAGTCIFVLLALRFVHEAEDYYKIPLFEAIGMFLTTLFSFAWVLKSYRFRLQLLPFKSVFRYLKENFSAFLNLLLPSTYGTGIVFLVGVFALPVHVSLMQIGVKFSGAFSTVNTVMTSVFYPLVNRNITAMFSTRMVLLGMGFFLSLGMFLFCNFLITSWLQFEEPSHLLQTVHLVKLLSPIPFLVACISSYGWNGLLPLYQDKLFGRITAFASAVMILAAVLLVPLHSYLGGAVALLLARIVHAGLSFYFFKKQHL